MHYIVWNFRYKCLKGLITAVPISSAIIHIYIYKSVENERNVES